MPLLQLTSASFGGVAQGETVAAQFADRYTEVRAIWQGEFAIALLTDLVAFAAPTFSRVFRIRISYATKQQLP